MLTDLRQTELDIAEEKILLAIFGTTSPSGKAQWLLNFLGIDINSWLREFEYLVKPILREDGLVDADLARSLLAERWPGLVGLVPGRPFRLSELVEPLAKLILGLKGRIK